MELFGKNNSEETKIESTTEVPAKEEKTKKISSAVLLQNDQEILEQLEILNRKMDTLDKNNKKFMMTASMNKNDVLEKKVISMKLSMITMLDQMYLLLDSLYVNADDKSKNGIIMTINAINSTLHDAEIEEIEVNVGDEFNPKIHQCLDTICDGALAQDSITALVKRGYRDISNGLVIRPADVVVNKK